MRTHWFAVFAVPISLLIASPASAGKELTACGPHEGYEQLVDELQTAVYKAKSAQDAARWKRLWDKIVAHRCFAISRHQSNGELPDPEQTESFRHWWNQGGHRWVSHATKADSVRFPPDVQELPGIASLACRPFDTECARNTLSWSERATTAFELASHEGPRVFGDEERAARTTDCSPKKTYEDWYECERGKRRRVSVLPIGSYRAPTGGWLVVQGRRGHYSFCDEVRVYHLDTGAAYFAQSCSGLKLRSDGHVDIDGTERNRDKVKVSYGRVEPFLLRETVWILVLSPHVKNVAGDPGAIALPKGMTRRIADANSGRFGSFGGGRAWISSAQTQLRWKWVRDGAAPIKGTLTWPSSSDAGEDHASSVLVFTEETFEEGCPPQRLESSFYVSPGKAGVSGIDADPRRLLETQSALVQALAKIKLPKRCQ